MSAHTPEKHPFIAYGEEYQMKKRFLLTALLLLFVLLLPILAQAETHGECGPATEWTLSDDGLLTITGRGSVDSNAFQFHDDIREIVIREGVTVIGDYTFHACNSLTRVSLPDSLTSIGKLAFGDCGKLADISIPDAVIWLGEEAFSQCSSLESIVIPGGVEVIRKQTFCRCSHLTSVVIREGITDINVSAFDKCGRLQEVLLPKSLARLNMNAFYGCASLTTATFLNPDTIVDYWVFQDCAEDLVIYCTAGSRVQDYAQANGIRWAPLSRSPQLK